MQKFIASLILLITCNITGYSQGLYQKFVDAYSAKDYKECVKNGKALIPLLDHPDLVTLLAECHCALGEFDESSALIEKLAQKGVVYNTDTMKVFQGLAKRGHTPPTATQQKIAFTLEDIKLVPEGIAYNPSDKKFYIGALAASKIITVDAKGKVKDFFIPQGSSWSFTGMKVFGEDLWACAFSENGDNNGHGIIFRVELKTGKLRDTYNLREGIHLFNDIVQGASGEMYITDSKARMVYRLKEGKFNPVADSASFIYPNGIAINEAKDKLYVAHWMGISVVDLKTEAVSDLDADKKIYLSSIDGLYWRNGGLVGIQNLKYAYRVVSIQINEDKVTAIKELARAGGGPASPTTGVFVGDKFYYIANSFVVSVKPDKSIKEEEKLKKTNVMELKIPK